MAASAQNDNKILDQTRQRLLLLANDLNALRRDLEISDPLPPWTAIQDSTTLISRRLQSVSEHLAQNQALLACLHPYPLPAFPVRAQGGLLQQLLRKKLEPDVEDWVSEGRETAMKASAKASYDEITSLWDWALPEAAFEIYGRIKWGLDYTMEEIEAGVDSVKTGINRELNDGGGSEADEGDEDDDDAEDEDEDAFAKKMDLDAQQQKPRVQPPIAMLPPRPMMPLEDILKFMSTGQVPRSLAYPSRPGNAFPVAQDQDDVSTASALSKPER